MPKRGSALRLSRMVSLRRRDVCVVVASYQGAHRLYLKVSMAFVAHPAWKAVIFAGAEIIY